MDEPQMKELSTCRSSESTVTLNENMAGETLGEPVDCGGQVQMVGECEGKDIMVGVLGSDVYIDGVCTRGSDAELNDEVGCGGSVEDKAVNPTGGAAGAQSEGSQLVRSVEGKSDNKTAELDGNDVTLDEQKKNIDHREVDKILEKQACMNYKVEYDEKLNSVGERPLGIDNVGGNSSSMINEEVAGAQVGVDNVPLNAEENQCIRLEKCIEKDRIAYTSLVSSDTGQGMEVDKDFRAKGFTYLGVEQNAGNHETVGASTSSDAQVCSTGEIDMIDSEGIGNFNQEVPGHNLKEQPLKSVEALEKDRGDDFALDDSDSGKKQELNKNVSDAGHVSLHEGQEVKVDDRSERIKIMNHTSDVQGTSVSFGINDKSLDANKISRTVEEGTQIADQGYFALKGAGKEKFNDEAPLSADDQKSKFMKCINQSVTSDVIQVESDVRQSIEGQADISEQNGSHGEQEIEDEEFNDAEQQKTTDGNVIKHMSMRPGSSGKNYQAGYQLPTEKEGEFSVYDMVWGKVRSHPWWPGQIFDPSDSSAKAMKHFKKDCYLVAYFGDRTFAWNEASQLKPFRTHFSYIEKHSNSEAFQNAVDSALDEVTRRVEFGLACSCIPKDTYAKIKVQIVENAGIRQGLSFIHVVDESLNVSSFSPERLIEFLKTLSVLPTAGFDRLELSIAKAQLLAFYRLNGYSYLPELQYCGGLDNDINTLTNDAEKNLTEVNEHATHVSKNDGQAGTGNLQTSNGSYRKRKHDLKDGMYSEKKKRGLSELAGGTPDSPHGDYWSDELTDNLVSPALSKKRRTIDHYADDTGMRDGRKSISLAKVSNTTKQSFKIGECIRRVASQLTGPPSMLKCSGDRSQMADRSADGFSGNGSDVFSLDLEGAQSSSLVIPTECSSLDDLLSLLQWVAQEPQGDYSFLNVMMSFFSDFRHSIIVGKDSGKEILPTNKVGTKRKKPPIGGSPETFEFDDLSDTYWTDMVIQNGSEEQPSQGSSRKDYQHAPAEPQKPVQVSRRSYSRKRYSDSNHAELPEKPSGYIDEKAPAELVLNFAELDSVPSETSLNKVFRRFGPLKESETEVDRGSSRARVVFKKCTDAEVAFSSAKKFDIFGPVLVNYELNYTPGTLFKASSFATTQDKEMHLDLSNFELNMA